MKSKRGSILSWTLVGSLLGIVILLQPNFFFIREAGIISKYEKQLKELKEDIQIEKKVANKFSRQIDNLTRIIRENIQDTVKVNSAEASVGEWKTVKVLAYQNQCLATIEYKINNFDKENKRYDVLVRDSDMAKKPNTHIRAFGCWQTGSVIYSDVYIDGQLISYPNFRSISSGDILKLLENPNINGYMNPTAVALTDILKEIVKQEIR